MNSKECSLQEYDISSEGLISIKFNKFGKANINIEKATLLNFSDLVAYNINLKFNFMKYWTGLSFIDEIFITKAVYGLPINSTVDLDILSGLDMKLHTRRVYDELSKITSKSIHIENGALIFSNQIYDFKDIYIVKSEKFLTAKASLSHNLVPKKMAFSAMVDLSLNDANILKFKIKLQGDGFGNFSYFEKLPKIIHIFLDKLKQDAVLTEKKISEIKFAGTYDLNSTTFNFQLSNPSRHLKFNSTINILDSVEKRSLLFRKAELVLRELSLLLSEINISSSFRTFDAKIKKIISPNAHVLSFLNDLTIKGISSSSDGAATKIKVLGANPSFLNASLEIAGSSRGSKNEDMFFDFLVQIDAFQTTDLDKFGSLFHLFSIKDNRGIKISNAKAEISLKFKNQYIEVNSFEAEIKKLVYLQNNKPFAELKNIDLKGNLKQAIASIYSVTTVESLKNAYKDIKIELSSTENIEQKREVTVAFKSKIIDLISLFPISNNDTTWINFLTSSQKEKEVSVTYSKVIALNKIENFFTLEETMFELNVKNLLIPLSANTTINLATLNLKGLGDTIFFNGFTAVKNKKISGSINNLLPYILSKGRTGNLTVFIDNFNSKELFPEFSALTIKGSVKLNFLPLGKDDNTFILSDINVTNANIHIPSLALRKVKGRYGQFKFNLTKNYKSSFQYSQNDVLVSGNAVHKSIFEINQVNYSIIKTPDILIERATFKKFGNYNQFKINKGTSSLDFLMRVMVKKKKMPLDIIFSDIAVTFKKNIFLNSLKGELRSFEGLRGYAKAKLSSRSNIEVIISPSDDNKTSLILSGNNAGELLRRGDFYQNGYGGMFKASISYKNKDNIEGSLEIEDFRIKKAPVLAQIISSASIIGLLDNLNGNGLLFTKIEGSFDYQKDKLNLKDGVAVGPSIGLTMGGYERYGKKENVVDVNGLVSPVYIINGVVKAIPLIGKVLGGEKGEGVFGMSYKVQGNSSNPLVSVNPLSILTPGVFRKIFSIGENGNK